MRPQNNRRPRSRSGNNNRRSGQATRNTVFDSNGPEVRVRGSASQVYEKYMSLARDAQAAGQQVRAEAFFQHAEHYLRILNATKAEKEAAAERHNNRQNNRQRDGDNNDNKEAAPAEDNADEEQKPKRNNRRNNNKPRPATASADPSEAPQPTPQDIAMELGLDLGEGEQPAMPDSVPAPLVEVIDLSNESDDDDDSDDDEADDSSEDGGDNPDDEQAAA